MLKKAGIGNCYGYYFKQTADIDLTGVAWGSIGYSGSYYFAGNYDGGDHSITNAVSAGKVDPDGYATAGIFGWVAFGSVENLHVKNANFVATGQKIIVMWAVLQVCAMGHPLKTVRL